MGYHRHVTRHLDRAPKAPLAFRVGVVGHRPDRLQQGNLATLSKQLREILHSIKTAVEDFPRIDPGLYADTPAVLHAVSPLAEGSDRLFAREAIALGYSLICPFPFAQGEFEEDFAPGRALESQSLDVFRALLIDAAKTSLTVFELDGTRADEPAAYAAGGRVVLNQSDILVVVWDGVHLGKHGGTETTLAAAQQRGIPIVWVDAHSPHRWQLATVDSWKERGDRAAPSAQSNEADLKTIVHTLLTLPAVNADKTGEGLFAFYGEPPPVIEKSLVWRMFRLVMGRVPWKRRPWRMASYKTCVPEGWPPNLAPFFAWMDGPSTYFANVYRGAFITTYILAVAAVGLSVSPVAFGWFATQTHGPDLLVGAAECAAILLIVGLVVRGTKRRWHERWIDYRLGAELLRYLRFTSALGGERPFPQLAAHLAKYGQPGATWVAWYVRAIERCTALSCARINEVYLRAQLTNLKYLIDEQSAYHQGAMDSCRAIEHRLHSAGWLLVGGTLMVAGYHTASSIFLELPHSVTITGVLIALGAFLPALGASLAGLNNQGEFRRIAKRSEAMVEHLTELAGEAATLLNDSSKGRPTLRWTKVTDLTVRASHLMVNEVLDWRVVFIDRPLSPPS